MVFGSCVFPAQGKSDNSLEKSDFSAGANDGSAYGFHEPYYKVTKSARKIAVFSFFRGFCRLAQKRQTARITTNGLSCFRITSNLKNA